MDASAKRLETHQLDIFDNLKEMRQTASTVSLNIGILYLGESLMSAWVSPVQSSQECSSAAASCNMLRAGMERFYIRLRRKQGYTKIQASVRDARLRSP